MIFSKVRTRTYATKYVHMGSNQLPSSFVPSQLKSTMKIYVYIQIQSPTRWNDVEEEIGRRGLRLLQRHPSHQDGAAEAPDDDQAVFESQIHFFFSIRHKTLENTLKSDTSRKTGLAF